MEPEIVRRPAFRVAGVVYRGKNENNEIPQMWGESWDRISQMPNRINTAVCYGVCDEMDEASGEFAYLAGFEVSRLDDLPEGIEQWDVPERDYAVVTTTVPTIQEGYRKVLEEWLPQSAYERHLGPDLELYDRSFNPDDPESILYLYIPVTRRAA